MSSADAPFSNPSTLYRLSPAVDNFRCGRLGSAMTDCCKTREAKYSHTSIQLMTFLKLPSTKHDDLIWGSHNMDKPPGVTWGDILGRYVKNSLKFHLYYWLKTHIKHWKSNSVWPFWLFLYVTQYWVQHRYHSHRFLSIATILIHRHLQYRYMQQLIYSK